jgi:hypothetical protein
MRVTVIRTLPVLLKLAVVPSMYISGIGLKHKFCTEKQNRFYSK